MTCWRLSVVLATLLFANGCRSRTPDAAELAASMKAKTLTKAILVPF